MLDILGSNRDLNIDIGEELKMLAINVEKLATYRIGMEKGLEKGLEKGAHEQAMAIAENLLEMGLLGAAQVAKATGLPLAEVEALAEKCAERRDG